MRTYAHLLHTVVISKTPNQYKCVYFVKSYFSLNKSIYLHFFFLISHSYEFTSLKLNFT